MSDNYIRSLISSGVCYTWSLEEDFIKYNKIPIEAIFSSHPEFTKSNRNFPHSLNSSNDNG